MFYRHRGGSAQSLILRTGYALLSGQLTANGTLQVKKPTDTGWLFCCLVDIWSELGGATSTCIQRSPTDRLSAKQS